jgi:hypothetical protein
MSTPTATSPVHDRDFGIDGPLLADVALKDTWPLADTRHGGRLLLFRNKRGWTVLTLRHAATWSDREPTSGFAHVSVVTHSDLTTIAAYMGTDAWRSLLEAGAKVDVDLRAIWTPVQIDSELTDCRTDLPQLAASPGGWQAATLAEVVARLGERHFAVWHSTTRTVDVFPDGLPVACVRRSSTIVGAAVVAKYGYRADLVIVLNRAGELYAQAADRFRPETPRRFVRPLTALERDDLDEFCRMHHIDHLRPLEPYGRVTATQREGF